MKNTPVQIPLRGKGAAQLMGGGFGGGAGGGTSGGGSDRELDIKDILAQLLARKWLIAIVAIVGAIVGAFQGQLPPDTFRATSTIQIEKRDSGVDIPSALIGELLGQPPDAGALATEIHVIRSRLIMGPVTERLDLDTRVVPTVAPFFGEILQRRNLPLVHWLVNPFIPSRYIRAGESVSARFTDVPEDQIGASMTLTVTGPTTYRLETRSGETFDGTMGEELTLGRFHTLIVDDISARKGRVFTIWKEPLRRTVSRISRGISVRERGNSGIVDFTYTAGTSRDAINIVNAVVAAYQNSNLERRSLQLDRSIAFIDEQLGTLANELAAANSSLLTYREERQLEQLSLDTQQILSRAVELETEIEALNVQEQILSETLTPNHPTYRALVQQRSLAQDRLDALRIDLETVPEAEQELARLTRDVERLTALETELIQRREQLGVQRASTVGNIRILEPAEEASRRSPSRNQPMIVGLVAGGALAVGFILLMNFFRRGIDDARTIEELGLPLFATIGKVDGLRSAGAASPLYALAETEPDHLSVEALRGLRTGLQFALATSNSRSLMITSTAPSDGKSFISFNLALVMAQARSNVLLIDADMRKGVLRKQFNLDRKHPGLAEFIAKKATLDQVIIQPKDRLIDFIPTGALPPNPADLLASPIFEELLKSASDHYDLVIVDAPPVLAVSDPAIIGQNTGMTLLVAAHLITTRTEIESALKALESVGIRPAGAVLNQFDSERSRYGQYGAKYGYYGGYQYKYKSSED